MHSVASQGKLPWLWLCPPTTPGLLCCGIGDRTENRGNQSAGVVIASSGEPHAVKAFTSVSLHTVLFDVCFKIGSHCGGVRGCHV